MVPSGRPESSPLLTPKEMPRPADSPSAIFGHERSRSISDARGSTRPADRYLSAVWVFARMPGGSLLSRRAPQRAMGASPLGWSILLGALAVVVLLLMSAFLGTVGPVGARVVTPTPAPLSAAVSPPPANFQVVNLTANYTTVDVSMAFNLSVNVVNLTGGALNASNYTFVWTDLPPYVPSSPGSGCYGVNPDNNSSVENCTAAAPGTFNVSVVATDYQNGEHNNSSVLSIVVSVLPVLSALSVSELNSTLGTQIWFNATTSGGTAPLTFAYTGLPLGCAGTNASFYCTPTRVGLYNVTVTAIDANGYSTSTLGAKVKVSSATKTATTGIGTTGWSVVIGIVVVGAIITIALLFQARREERAGRMGMEESPPQPPQAPGGTPPMGGTPPPGPPS
jgi:hypothetical protein